MGFSTGSGAVIKVGVEGAGESRRQIEGIGDSFNKLPGVVRGAMTAVAASLAAALSVTAFAGMIKGSLDAAAGVHDLSIETGASAASLMKFREIGLTSDTTIQSITGSMNKLAKNMAVANEESKGTGQAVKALGLNFDELKQMSPEVKLMTVAKALNGFQDGAGKSAVAMTLLGKEGAKQLPFLTDLANEADSVAASLTKQEIATKAALSAMADDFGDNLTKIQHSGEEWKRDLAFGVVPALLEASQAFIDVTSQAGGFKGEVKRLSEDGSIAEWTRVAITGVTYLMDAFQGAGRIVKAVGMYIGASLAAAVTNITGIANAMALFIRGEYSQSWDAIKSTATATVGIGKDLMSDLSDTFSAQSFGSKIRERMDEVKGLGGAAKEVKKALNFSANGDDDAAAAAALKKETEAYAGLISSIRTKTEENKLELLVGENALPSQKERIKLDQELSSGKLKLTDAHKLEAYAALDAQEASDKLVRAMQAERDVTKYVAASAIARKDSAAQLKVEYDLYGKSADAREIAMVAIKEQTALEKFLLDEKSAGKSITEDQIARLNEEAAARSKVEQAALAQTKALGYAGQLADQNKRFIAESIMDEQGRAAALLQIDAQMWQERIALAGEGTDAQKKLQGEYDSWYQNQLLKPQLESQKKIWDSIEQTAHDTWISMADGAKGAAQRARDTLKNILFDWLYQMTVKKWIFNLSASVTGSTASGVAQAAGAAGNGGSILGAVGSIGSAISSAGTLLGSSAISAFGSGFTAAVTAGSGEAAMLASAATAGNLSAGAAAGASAGGFASGIASGASAALAAIPVWGWAALAGAAAIAYFSNSGPEDHTRLNFTSNNAGGNISINERGNEGKSDAYIGGSGKSAFGTFGVSSTFWMEAAQPVVQDFIKTVSQTDDALASFLTEAEKASVSSFLTGKVSIANTGAEGTNPNASGELDKVFADRINSILEGVTPGLSSLVAGFTGTSEALAKEAAALLQYRAALKDSGEAVFGVKITLQEIAALKNTGELTSTALARVTNEFAATNQVAELLGKTGAEAFGAVGLASISAREQLIAASGTIETLTQQTASFAQNYFTEAERLVPVVKSVDAQMAALGLSSVKTMGEFKSTVLALDLTSSSGVATYAALMNVQAAFAQVHPAIDAATSAVSEATVQTTDAAAIAKEQRSLDIELLEALGKGEQALAMKRSDALDSLLSDTARATQMAINAANDTAAAIAKAKDSSAAFMSFGNALADSMTKAQDAAASLRKFNESMLLGNLSALSPEQRYLEAKRQRDSASAEDLPAAANAFLQASKEWFGSSGGFASDFASTRAMIDGAAAQKDAYAASIPAFWKMVQESQMFDGSHANGLNYVPFNGYRAILHEGERVQTKAQAAQADGASSEVAGLMREMLTELRADKVQRGAVGTATLARLEQVAGKIDSTRRELARAS